jgi:hypothetical protein
MYIFSVNFKRWGCSITHRGHVRAGGKTAQVRYIGCGYALYFPRQAAIRSTMPEAAQDYAAPPIGRPAAPEIVYPRLANAALPIVTVIARPPFCWAAVTERISAGPAWGACSWNASRAMLL